MKPRDLHAVWSAPDNTRLTSKQSSFRLPVHVAAKLSALADIYPNKTKTQIVGDLLSTAIEEVIAQLPSEKGAQIGLYHPPGEVPFKAFEDIGLSGRFMSLADRYFKELEAELGNDSPKPLYGGRFIPEELTPEEIERDHVEPADE